MAKRSRGDDYGFKKAALANAKQKRQEQKRQDQKARKAGRAERAAERGSAQYGYGSSASDGRMRVRRVSDEGETG